MSLHLTIQSFQYSIRDALFAAKYLRATNVVRDFQYSIRDAGDQEEACDRAYETFNTLLEM